MISARPATAARAHPLANTGTDFISTRLDTTLKLPATSKRKAVDAALAGHILGQTTLTGRYSREPAKAK